MNFEEKNRMIKTWQQYFQQLHSWEKLIVNFTPKQTGCGRVYELKNPINRPNESFAIADMRNISFADPHYHTEMEIYFILQGEGIVVVGKKEERVKKGS